MLQIGRNDIKVYVTDDLTLEKIEDRRLTWFSEYLVRNPNTADIRFHLNQKFKISDENEYVRELKELAKNLLHQTLHNSKYDNTKDFKKNWENMQLIKSIFTVGCDGTTDLEILLSELLVHNLSEEPITKWEIELVYKQNWNRTKEFLRSIWDLSLWLSSLISISSLTL